MSEIKLSVIVPTYNSSNTIERLIHSLSNQIFKDFDIVFIVLQSLFAYPTDEVFV